MDADILFFAATRRKFTQEPQAEQAAKALPEDEAVLKNGERQGERGHPPGGALAPAASPQPLQQRV